MHSPPPSPVARRPGRGVSGMKASGRAANCWACCGVRPWTPGTNPEVEMGRRNDSPPRRLGRRRPGVLCHVVTCQTEHTWHKVVPRHLSVGAQAQTRAPTVPHNTPQQYPPHPTPPHILTTILSLKMEKKIHKKWAELLPKT